jgi:response regulator RpfG family c-di-GMP phosphodiesterase
MRLDSARARHEMMAWRETAQELAAIMTEGRNEDPELRLRRAAKKAEDFSRQMQNIRLAIVGANQPQVLEEDFDIADLMTWINKASRELGQAVLMPEEMIKLSLPRGSLGDEERREIESHVSHTYQFLRQIAWTEDLANVADIAHAHHEKCDGTGYPRGLTAEHIPVQAKMMTIADIYDALTSMDRPYKPATSPERALEILYMEGREGKLDLELLKVFVEADIFRMAQGMGRRRAAA